MSCCEESQCFGIFMKTFGNLIEFFLVNGRAYLLFFFAADDCIDEFCFFEFDVSLSLSMKSILMFISCFKQDGSGDFFPELSGLKPFFFFSGENWIGVYASFTRFSMICYPLISFISFWSVFIRIYKSSIFRFKAFSCFFSILINSCLYCYSYFRS